MVKLLSVKSVNQTQGVLETIKFFFRFEPKQTETQSFSVVFRFVSRNQKTFFSVCFGVSDRYRNNRNKQNFLETKRKTEKNLKKTFSIRESLKPLIFFLGSNRNKPKVNLFHLFFSLLFRENKKKFRFVSLFRTSIEATETNRTYGMGNLKS